MKTIIVPVDFSEDSIKALQKAVYIARKVGAGITLFHVQKVKSFPALFSSHKDIEPSVDIEKSFKDMMQSVEHIGVNMDYRMRSGKVAKEIIHFAEEVNAYMIVMGTHGASGFEEFWMGSNAYRVVSDTPCPVITIRGNGTRKDIKKIVLPIDTSGTTRQKVPFTMELAKFFHAEVHVIGVCVDETEELVMKLTNYTAQVSRHLNKHGVNTVNEFITGDNPTTMAIDYAKKVDADLISIMTDQESNVLSAFIGAYAQQMVNHSPIPVLSMHKNPDLEGNVSIM